MKKHLLLPWLILVLSAWWIALGADCSYYQQLITYYENSIAEYQNLAAWYSASMASQMSAAGLSASAIWSATSSNPYASTINELQWNLIKAKSDYTNCVYNSELNNIQNQINSLKGTTKSEWNRACKQSFGNYAEVAPDDYSMCVCMNWYIRNSAWTSCIRYTKDVADKECRNEFGSNSEAKSDDYSKCVCKSWYEWNSAWTSCVKKTYTKAEADKLCQNKFWANFAAVEWNLSQCSCKEWYEFNDDWSDCVKADPCHTYGPNSYLGYDNQCYCKAWFEWNYNNNVCVADRQNSLYEWKDFRNAKDLHDYTLMLLSYEDYQSCLKKWMQPINNCKDFNGAKCACTQCEDWYYLSNNGACLRSSNNTTNIVNNNTVNTSNTNNGWYPKDFKDAYAFAYQNKITTMPTIEEANMDWEIIRAEIAKMLANWVKSLWIEPDKSAVCKFNDISWVKWDLYTAIIESCQLGIMWQWIEGFRPFDKITKWEVATAVSRIIWGNKHDSWTPYYLNHMNALKNAWILNDIYNAEVNELRWNVMVTLMKASYTDELTDCDDPAVLLACSLDDPACPAKCQEEDDLDVDALVDEILNWN